VYFLTENRYYYRDGVAQGAQVQYPREIVEVLTKQREMGIARQRGRYKC